MSYKDKVTPLVSKSLKILAAKAAPCMLLALWLLTFTAAGVPQLHHLLHQDSQEAGHRCVVSQVQQQLFLAGIDLVCIPTACTLVTVLEPEAPFSPAQRRERLLPPDRGPPAPFCSFTVAG